MARTIDGLKPTRMTPIITGQEDRGLKPARMTPVQPTQPTQAPVPPAEAPKK
jgi:hypothetical protein